MDVTKSKYRLSSKLTLLPEEYYPCFGTYRKSNYKKISLYPDLTFEIDYFRDQGGTWRTAARGCFVVYNHTIYFIQDCLRSTVREPPLSIKEAEGTIYLFSTTHSWQASSDWSNGYQKQKYPKTVVCLTTEQFPVALTANKKYYALKQHSAAGLIWLVGDNNRVRWFPERIFAEVAL